MACKIQAVRGHRIGVAVLFGFSDCSGSRAGDMDPRGLVRMFGFSSFIGRVCGALLPGVNESKARLIEGGFEADLVTSYADFSGKTMRRDLHGFLRFASRGFFPKVTVRVFPFAAGEITPDSKTAFSTSGLMPTLVSCTVRGSRSTMS